MKKLSSIVLVLSLLASALALSAFGEEDAAVIEGAAEETEVPDAPETAEEAEVTATPEPAATPESTEMPSQTAGPVTAAARLQIDDKNIYEGMDKAYKDGYVPQVADGVVTLVMPLTASGSI